MRRVEQKDEKGCAVACVAMLAGITYAKAKALEPELDVTDGLDYEQLRCLLRLAGLQFQPRPISFFGKKPTAGEKVWPENDAILAVNERSNGSFHYVVWDARRRRILDPLKRAERIKRFRFHSYIPVYR